MLTTTEVTVKLKKKVVGTYPYGKEMCLYVRTSLLDLFYSCNVREIEDKPEGELSLQIHTINRFNQHKKMGRSNIALSKLEDGKCLETWYSFSKKTRKGTVKPKGYLKVKVTWLSAVVSIYILYFLLCPIS